MPTNFQLRRFKKGIKSGYELEKWIYLKIVNYEYRSQAQISKHKASVLLMLLKISGCSLKPQGHSPI